MITVYPGTEKKPPVAGLYGMTDVPAQSAADNASAVLTSLEMLKIKPGVVLDGHSHCDAEILTYVIDGILDYRDNTGSRHLLMGGEVQIVSAPAGISHGAGNASHSEALHVVQAIIRPAEATPGQFRCEQRYFSDDARLDQLCLIASADGRDGSLLISQDANIYAALLRHEDPVLFNRGKNRTLRLLVTRGSLRLNDTSLATGDTAVINGDEHTNVRLRTDNETEVVLFDLPCSPSAE